MGFITKQRRVGGSQVFTVPKQIIRMSQSMVREGNDDLLYQVSRREDGTIVYTPLQIQPLTLAYSTQCTQEVAEDLVEEETGE
jgi:hypothetical protein